MKPESLHKVAETLRSVHHHYLGVTAHPPKPAHAPAAARLERPDIQSFTGALDRATSQWPGTDLCLIGAHGAIGPTNIDDPTDTLPPTFLQFLDPETLLRIPVGDPEDQGDQIDIICRRLDSVFQVPLRLLWGIRCRRVHDGLPERD